MKQKCRVLLACVLVLSLISTSFMAYAAESALSPLPQTPQATLTDDNGNVEVVTGRLVDIATPFATMGDAAVTYAFDLYRANHSLSTNDHDGAYASTVYLTIEYKTQNTPTEYLLTRVRGYWTINVANVEVTEALLNYGCNGVIPQIVQDQYVNDLSVHNNFSYATGFDRYVADMEEVTAVGANLTLYYRMGTTRTWTFHLENNIVTP